MSYNKGYEEGLAEGFIVGSGLELSKHTHCIKCDYEIPRNAKYCPRCGARQPPTDW